jgi:HPt (histidine-containing phosphotransfer) domain-containing protein
MGADWKKMERVLVEVDPDLTDLIPAFLTRKRADALTIRDAIENGDFVTVAALGHKLKGEGGSFGFDVITEIGAALEQAARQQERDSALKLALDLSEYLEKVEVVPAPD